MATGSAGHLFRHGDEGLLDPRPLSQQKSAGFQRHAFGCRFFCWLFSPRYQLLAVVGCWLLLVVVLSSIIELEKTPLKWCAFWMVGFQQEQELIHGRKKQDLSWLNVGTFLVTSWDITRVGSKGASKSPQKPPKKMRKCSMLASGRVCG